MEKLAKELERELRKNNKNFRETLILLDSLESQGVLKKTSYDIIHIGMIPCDKTNKVVADCIEYSKIA